MKVRIDIVELMLLAGGAFLIGACGGDEVCDVAAQTGCDEGFVCENVQNGEPACFSPVVMRGQVFDLLDSAPVGGANVVALDINGAALTSVAVTATDGSYELSVPSTRREDGSPVPVEVTLRSDAAAYQTFPSGLRQALPIDTGAAVEADGVQVVESALTDIGLIPLPDATGLGSISGTVELPEERVGILVVAESSAGTGYAGIANRDGGYRIFNLPSGDYTVQAYARGVNYMDAAVSLPASGDETADLSILAGTEAGVVMGDVQIVNAPGGSLTTVILAVESTFDDFVGRGQTVPGLRAPDPGLEPSIEGAYEITGVPHGRYVVLAAFENDALVRDPDLSISGTATLHIQVTAGETTTVEGFKVTEALEIFSPGAEGPEEVSGAVSFSWADDSSEDGYTVEVFDAFGELIWETTTPSFSGQDPTVPYEGPALEPGMYYQYRVTSMKDGVPISRTEDLKGIFYTAGG